MSVRKKRPLFLPPQARDEDGHGEKLPHHSYSKETPRLVFKTNSDVLVRNKAFNTQLELKCGNNDIAVDVFH